jgi:hypothetical protein
VCESLGFRLQGGVLVKRLFVASMVVMAGLVWASGSALAKGGHGATIDRFPVSFSMSSATCSHLPNGTTINGSGIEKSTDNTRTKRGVTTEINTSHANGTATDQNGNRYRFNYSNHFRVKNTVGNPGEFSGKMVDSFSLAGPGPAKVHNGFLARFTTDFATFFNFDPIHSRGDPLGFPDGTAHCDPL